MTRYNSNKTEMLTGNLLGVSKPGKDQRIPVLEVDLYDIKKRKNEASAVSVAQGGQENDEKS